MLLSIIPAFWFSANVWCSVMSRLLISIWQRHATSEPSGPLLSAARRCCEDLQGRGCQWWKADRFEQMFYSRPASKCKLESWRGSVNSTRLQTCQAWLVSQASHPSEDSNASLAWTLLLLLLLDSLIKEVQCQLPRYPDSLNPSFDTGCMQPLPLA